MSCIFVEILFLFLVFQSSFFSAHGNRKRAVTDLQSPRSVVTSQVNHVVRLSVSAVSSVSPVSYHEVWLLLPTW